MSVQVFSYHTFLFFLFNRLTQSLSQTVDDVSFTHGNQIYVLPNMRGPPSFLYCCIRILGDLAVVTVLDNPAV